MVTKKGSDGVFWKRGEGRELIYYWKIGSLKSKTFSNQEECAKDYIKNFVERNPKYVPLVEEKTWEQLFRMFGVKIH